MISKADCPFCEIAAGRAPAVILHSAKEWEGNVIIMEPLSPVTDGHVLALPCEHITDAVASPVVTGRVMQVAAKYARGLAMPVNIVAAVGTQTTPEHTPVHHLHLHIIPRRANDGIHLPWVGQHDDDHDGTGAILAQQYGVLYTRDPEAEIVLMEPEAYARAVAATEGHRLYVRTVSTLPGPGGVEHVRRTAWEPAT